MSSEFVARKGLIIQNTTSGTTETDVLVKDANGLVKYISSSSLTTTDTFVSGATMNGNTLELSRTEGLSDVTVDLSQFIDDTNDGVVSGATMNGNTLELSRTEGLGLVSVDLSQFIDDTNDGVVSGATMNGDTLELSRTEGLDIVSVDLSQFASGTNNYVTGFTYNNTNGFTVSVNDGNDYTAVIDVMTGLTVSGNLSATKYYSGATELGSLFALAGSNTDDITRVQGGTNISTGGTANVPIINLDDDIVLGSVNATTLTGGTIYSGGTELSTLFAPAGGPTGSGTANYLARWTGSTALADSIIRDDGTNASIGAAIVSLNKFYIAGSSSNSQGLQVNQTAAVVNNNAIRSLAGGGTGTNRGGIFVSNPSGAGGISVGVETGTIFSTANLPSHPTGGTVSAIGLISEVQTNSGNAGHNLGIYTESITSHANDNIGIHINTSNAGAGAAYAMLIEDGNEGAGKVLTSDAYGFASWETAAGGDNLGNADLTASTGTRTFNLGGNLVTDKLVFERNNGIDLLNMAGDGLVILGQNASSSPTVIVNEPAGNLTLRGGTNTGFTLYGDGTTVNTLGLSAGASLNLAATKTVRFLESGVGSIWVSGDRIQLSTASTTFGTGAKNFIALENGTAPTTDRADKHVYYSADQAAGNAAPHFRTENGSIVKLYEESAVTTSQGIADALTNIGLLASGSTIPTVTDTNNYVTGFTYNNSNMFTVSVNDGNDYTATINTMSGLTVDGDLTVNGSSVFSGGTDVVHIYGSGDVEPTLLVEGSSGELFAVTDSLEGTLFTVNDISGLPILEVNDDNTILMGSYLAPSLNTTTKITATAGSTVAYTMPSSDYTSAYYDYNIYGTTGARAGNIMAIWSGDTVQFSETVTNDIGDTSAVFMNVTSTTGGTASLSVSATTGTWVVKTIIRSI